MAADDVTYDAPPAHGFPPWIKLAISVFVVWHWAAVSVWIISRAGASSGARPLTVAVPPAACEYLFATGQWQYWNMFAPPPGQGWKSSSLWLEATVEFSDGSRKEYALPRPSQDRGWAASMHAGYLKYQHRILEKDNVRFRADLARFIARSMPHTSVPPIRVTLYYCTVPLPRHDAHESASPNVSDFVDYTARLRDEPVRVRREFFSYVCSEDDQ